jgi:hypothetical protein
LYLHIFFFDPITILLENLGQLGIRPLEEDHQNIETTEETEGWLTRADNLRERAMSRKLGLLTHVGVSVCTEDTSVADWDYNFDLHLV